MIFGFPWVSRCLSQSLILYGTGSLMDLAITILVGAATRDCGHDGTFFTPAEHGLIDASQEMKRNSKLSERHANIYVIIPPRVIPQRRNPNCVRRESRPSGTKYSCDGRTRSPMRVIRNETAISHGRPRSNVSRRALTPRGYLAAPGLRQSALPSA